MFDLINVCRLCMHGVQNAPRIYNCLTEGIRNLIKKIHGFEVKSDDHLPKALCIECHQKLQHFATHLNLVERVQDEIQKLVALELEATTVKTEPQEEQQTVAEAVRVKEILQQDTDDSASTISHISARSLEQLEEPLNELHSRKELNSTKSGDETISKLARHSRSEKRSFTKEKNTQSKSEIGKRKRDRSRGEEIPNKSKKARPVTLKRVVNSSPNRMEYEITNGPQNTERANRGRNTPKELNAVSTPLRSKNDQITITKFFKKANTCEHCGTFSKNPAYLKFHENFHSTRQCSGCFIKFAGEESFDVAKHIDCFLLKSNLSIAELRRTIKMKVTIPKLFHEEIRKVEPNCCTEKLPSKPKTKDRKRQASPRNGKSKKTQSNRKGCGKSNKSSSAVIDKSRVERKKTKSKSTTGAKGAMDKSMEIEDIEDVSIPLNWNPETAKDKVFWIRSFGSNNPIYIPIRSKGVQTNIKLTKTIQSIDEFKKKASEAALNFSENNALKMPLAKVGVNIQNQSSPRAIPRCRSASVFIPVPDYLNHEVVRRDQSPAIGLTMAQKQPTRALSKPVSIIPTNSGIITCIQKSALLNSSNPSDVAQNMNAPKQAGLINARRKSVATEMTRIAMNKSYHQANHAPPARRYSVSLERQPYIPSSPIPMLGHYHQDSPATANTNAPSLRSINFDHSYTGQSNPNHVLIANNPQMNQTPNHLIGQNVAYSPQMMTNIVRGTFLPSPFPISTPTSNLVAPAIINQVPNTIQQPKRTQLKVLTVADLNAKVPTDNNLSSLSQPIPYLDHTNPSGAQVSHASGFSVPKPRMKLTPLRPHPPETSSVIPDTEAISVSLSKIHDDQIELTLTFRDERIEYDSLNDRQKTDVRQCLIRDNIWRTMLGHIKEGKPTQEALNLFRKILPPKERQEFFETYYGRR